MKQRTFTRLLVTTRIIDRMHALADADDQNPDLDFFDRLGNPIPYGNNLNNNNEDYAGDLAGVQAYKNQMEIIPRVKTSDQEEIPGVATLEEEEEIPEEDIPEEEDQDTDIIGVDQNTKDPGVNHTTGANNVVPGNPPGPIPTNNNNTYKVETVNNESDTEEDETEEEKTIQYQKAFEFQVN